MSLKNIKKGFSLVELVIVIAILAILIAVLTPSLMTYTERSRAQKDVTTMDEVVNSVQLAMADQDCYDEMLKYSCSNNFITYTDSSGNYGQVIADGEYWAPDGLGRATTITFNPEKDSQGNTIYRLENAIVNDMTFGNGSVAENRVMQGAQTDNQCYLKNASINGSQTGYLYNRVRQSIGDDVITTSATYANSSFTIFIKFNQKDGVTVADVEGSFNGTNLSPDSSASKGSGTTSYDKETGKPIVNTNHESGKTEANFSSSDLSGGGSFYPEYAHGTIPEDGKYTTSSGETLTPGETNRKPQDGDVYTDAWYEYRYNSRVESDFDDWFDEYYIWVDADEQNGWGVRVLDCELTSYGPMLSEINGQPVNNLYMTFAGCYELTTAPTISTNATDIRFLFDNCYELTDITNFSIPKNATSLWGTFSNCEKLTSAKSLHIPNNITEMSYTFYMCYELVEGPTIPESVTQMQSTYGFCKKLTTAPKLPSKLVNASGLFTECYELKTYEGAPIGMANGDFSNYQIPNTVTDMVSMFRYCKLVTHAPTLPNRVLNIGGAFDFCDSLIEAPIIPSSVTRMASLFRGCKNLETYKGNKDGSGNFSNYVLPNGITTLSTAFNECKKIKFAPKIPSTVTDLEGAFYHSGLIQAPEIPENVTTLSRTFWGTNISEVPKIPDKVTNLYHAFDSCTKLTDISDLVIPSSVYNCDGTFEGCTSITKAPYIPQTVTNIRSMFDGCKSLSGTIVIDAQIRNSVYNYSDCLRGTVNPIVIKGLCPYLSKIKSSSSNNNVTIQQ